MALYEEIKTRSFEVFMGFLQRLVQERTVAGIFDACAQYFPDKPMAGLLCVWLTERQPLAEAEPERAAELGPLSLVFTSGWKVADPATWQRPRGESLGEADLLDGAEPTYARIPPGESFVGRAARDDAQQVAANRVEWAEREEPDAGEIPLWARAEGLHGFLATPLEHKGMVHGVLAILYYEPLSPRDMESKQWHHRIAADYIAAAVANARAFEEIDRLRKRLEQENRYLRKAVKEAHSFGEVVGESEALGRVLEQVELVAPTDASVLLLGESGTGKELIARAIHERSSRSGRPLIKVNCSAVPRELFESEFFGHVKGAFTGAVKDRVGRFQLADKGTLFLDEVGEIPLELQSKLLRVLQEETFERIGEERSRHVDVRIIAATNQDLKKRVAEGAFREDLYFRLSVFPLFLPPLRERPEDIPHLAKHFIELTCRKLNVPQPELKLRHIKQLSAYSWPGNIRELKNLIERAVIVAQEGALDFSMLAADEESRAVDVGPLKGTFGSAEYCELYDPLERVGAGRSGRAERIVPEAEWRVLQKANIERALKASGGVIGGPRGAAALLGLKPTTLQSRMKKLGVAAGPRKAPV